MVYKTKVGHYRRYFLKYGSLPMLNVLKEFEQREYFEECHKIKKAIEEQSKVDEIRYPTKLDNKEVLLAKQTLKKDYDIVNVNALVRSFTKEIIFDIQTKYRPIVKA